MLSGILGSSVFSLSSNSVAVNPSNTANRDSNGRMSVKCVRNGEYAFLSSDFYF